MVLGVGVNFIALGIYLVLINIQSSPVLLSF